MDRINQYRQIVQEFSIEFAQKDGKAQIIFDQTHDQYLVMHNEWREDYRIYGCAIQLDIIEGQVWIQHNSTEIYLDRELISRGVLPQDVILGFRAPNIRQILMTANR